MEKWMIRILTALLLVLIHGLALKSFSAPISLAQPFCELKSIIVNSDSIQSLGEKLQRLVAEQQCVVQAVPCDVKAESFPSRALGRYQIAISDVAKFGVSTTHQLMEAVGRLQSVGLCEGN